MRGIWVIAKRETKAIYGSVLFYAIGGLCTVLWSVIYMFRVSDFASRSRFAMPGQEGPNIHFDIFAAHISLVNFIMILAIAAITMRFFAEEKKNRSFDLLLTSPVTSTQIVLGKFVAGFLGAAGFVLLSFLYPVSLAFIAPIDWGPLLTSYFGLLLLVSCYVAIGMFASSLTENLVLAVVMALIFSVGIWFIGSGSDAFESPILTKMFEHLNVSTHFVGYIKGSISIASTVFFLSVIGLYIFLTQRVVESSRWR